MLYFYKEFAKGGLFLYHHAYLRQHWHTPLRDHYHAGGCLQEMGLRGREVGKTLLGIRLARMDGYITSREGEVGYAQSRLLAQREERRN